MERKEIHRQISAIIDKIIYLNKNLEAAKEVHNVELDLLKVYSQELRELIHKLELQKSAILEDIIDAKETTLDFGDKIRHAEAEDAESKNEDETVESKEIEKAENIQHNLADIKTEGDISEEINLGKEKEEFLKTDEVVQENKEQIVQENSADPVNPQGPIISAESFETAKDNDEENVSLNEKLKLNSFEVADKLKFGERKNLKDKIDLNERYVFIQELFEGDAEYFNKSLRKLDECNSIEQAQDYIKTSIEVKYSWEEKQKYATRFIELILNNFDEINKN